MMRKHELVLLISGLIGLLLLASAVSAQSVVRMPGKVILSQELVDAMFQRLSQDPYASVAPLLGKLQAEAAPQLAPQQQPPPEPKPDEKK
jgi:hypothetical protein